MKILIIEDDSKIVKAIGFAFQVGWPETKLISAEWGQEGIDLVEKEAPDLVILDLGLPDMDGLDVIKHIRLFSKVPIMVLTVNSDETIVVQALELGANEYVVKPFRQMELIARIKSLVTWHKNITGGDSLIWGPFLYDRVRRELIRDEQVINLTSTENDILVELIRNAPDVVPYQALSMAIWGDNYDGATDSLKVHIRHLREKIEENPGKPRMILTKTGVGYFTVMNKS
jgi:two-component system KDP operon response regulator KdpE